MWIDRAGRSEDRQEAAKQRRSKERREEKVEGESLLTGAVIQTKSEAPPVGGSSLGARCMLHTGRR